MSWMEKLYQTYDQSIQLDTPDKPWPISHFVKTAHIEVVLDGDGNLISDRIKLLSGEDAATLIPATVASAGKAGSKIAPHPLCDEIGYCAADFPNAIPERIDAYLTQLKEWRFSTYTHPKVIAVYNYLEKRSLWKDLTQMIEFPITFTNKRGLKTKVEAEKAFIRWRVEVPGNPCSGTWEDEDLIHKWIEFDRSKNTETALCYITGKNVRLIENHSKFIRNSTDGAKLISSNDSSGYTYRGRFIESTEAYSVSFEVSQKAHNALRWLISRQNLRNDDLTYVAWAPPCAAIPKPVADAWSLLNAEDFNLELIEDDTEQLEQETSLDQSKDLGQQYALQLKKYMAGYAAKLSPNEQVIIMGLDSATPGRMSIIYYRELFSHEFLQRLENWHRQFAWPQRFTTELPGAPGKKPKTKVIWPVSSPVPKDVAVAAYGDNVDDTLKKKVIERLLPCIIDGQTFPLDLVNSCIRKATNRNGYASDKQWLWEKNLGIACALYKGYHLRHPNLTERREYAMSLEENYHSRDYLYGRLLAIAERIEEVALHVGGENRTTTAARLMQRFADHPYETWRTIELALQPYIQRLKVSRAGFLNNQLKEMDQVLSLFEHEDFARKDALAGEFLLGFHCQRHKFKNKNDTADDNTTSDGDNA
jgi:CRISPR-associated protein Csd1